MAGTTIRFTAKEDKKGIRNANIYQDKTFDISYLLRAHTPDMPERLSSNSIIYNQDTGEMFIGMGDGYDMKPVTNKLIEQQIQTLTESTYTKQEIDDFIDHDLDLDGIVDRLNLYTVQKIDELLENKGNEIVQLRQDINELLTNDYVTKDTLNTTLQEYYTKDEVNRLINEAVTQVLTTVTNMIE